VEPSQEDVRSKLTSIESAGGKSRGANRELNSSKGGSANGTEKYDIPKTAKLELLKAARI
jgi:hypothetical protein